MFDFVKFIAFFVVLVAAIAGIAFGAAKVLGEMKCSSFEATGYQTELFGLTCYAKVDGKFVPVEYVFGDAVELRTKN